MCVLDADGRRVMTRSVPCRRDELAAFAREHLRTDDVVVVEATLNTWAVVTVLEPLVGRVAVGNPLQIRAIAQAKVKTDAIDAQVAHLLRLGYLPEVWRPDADNRRRISPAEMPPGTPWCRDRTRLAQSPSREKKDEESGEK